ncbi:helix-turn-helix domain-containing protein [Shinella sp.]|uniref:helix-turn-helix domain-containing protein n=1 Tax=Shinella sp. TaxID=1870904 RepID=UPI0029BF7D33|nr:helix-turn-helix domain-containing protein [Shinella sp.]MDX3975769.1 helix-turn-helix domain-containing protein [Shinella sp.]
MVDENTRSRLGSLERRRYPRVTQDPLGVSNAKKGILVPLRFETESLPPLKQFPAWQEYLSTLLDLRLPDNVYPQNGFVARQTVWNLGGMLLVQQTSPAFSYERLPDKVRLSPFDHWYITFLRSGQTWTEVDGRVAQNEPGLMEIRSFGRPFRGRKVATTSTSLIAPVDLFSEQGGLPAASNNVVLGGHRIRLLADYLSSVEANLDFFTKHDLLGTQERLREMIFEAVTPLVDRNADKDQISGVGLMTRARRFILSHISSPDLTAEALCRELAISRTRLYELFETSGGVANYIRRRRLLAAHATLADPSDTHKIAEVGAALGFDSPANFSRAFTQQFGYSPSNIYKHNAEQKPSPTQGAGGRDAGRQMTFEGMLRTLGLF